MQPNRFTDNLTNTDLHTNGYGEAAAEAAGQINTDTFEMRIEREKKRLVIGGYKDSFIGAAGYRREAGRLRVPKRASRVEPADTSGTEPGRQSYNVKNSAVKPPSIRHFDPYS